MDLDPKLAAIAAAAIAPTKILVDALISSLDVPSRFRLLVAFLVALAVVSVIEGYQGDIQTAPDMSKLIAGNLLAGFTAWTGAVLATELHKNADKKKIERSRKKVLDDHV